MFNHKNVRYTIEPMLGVDKGASMLGFNQKNVQKYCEEQRITHRQRSVFFFERQHILLRKKPSRNRNKLD